jgi:hypothetical protein
MEQSSRAAALRSEYVELLARMYGTALTGFERAKAYHAVTFFGMIITQSALFGALYFLDTLDEMAVTAILTIVVLSALWWFYTIHKELSRHEDMKRANEALEKKMADIEQEYVALTKTQLRGTFTAREIHEKFEPLFKRRGIELPPLERRE